MKEPAVAKLIWAVKKANVPLKMLILQLVSAVDYYNSEELSKLSQTLDEIEHQNQSRLPSFRRIILWGSAVIWMQSRCIWVWSGRWKIRGNLMWPTILKAIHIIISAVHICVWWTFRQRRIILKKLMSWIRTKYRWSVICGRLKDGDESGFFDTSEQYHLSETYIGEVLKTYDDEKAKMTMGQEPTDEEAKKVLKRLKGAYRG